MHAPIHLRPRPAAADTECGPTALPETLSRHVAVSHQQRLVVSQAHEELVLIAVRVCLAFPLQQEKVCRRHGG